MIIDIHGHVSAPQGLYAFKAFLLASRGFHGAEGGEFSDEEIDRAMTSEGHKEFGPVGHIGLLDQNGTDFQLLSPRPFHMMHSEKPGKIVHWFTRANNNIIAQVVKLHPDRFAGVAGLPQAAGEPVENVLPELERCVKELGFKGCLLNSDPYEHSEIEPPALSDRYWYPLYEKLCELDVPAMLHGCGSHSLRTSYSTQFINEETTAMVSLVNSEVFNDFPTLKIIVPHGGGAVPYQLGRFQAPSLRRKGAKSFLDRMRNLYFDSVLYTPEALELLVKVVGADRVLFGTECPGTGTVTNPETGRHMDDIKPHFENFAWLSDADRKLIFEDNARKLYKLDI